MENPSGRQRLWFWSGVILLSIVAFFWFGLIVSGTAEPRPLNEVAGVTIIGLLITSLPTGLGIYCVRRGRKSPVTVVPPVPVPPVSSARALSKLERILGTQPLARRSFPGQVFETLLITSDRLIVARTRGGRWLAGPVAALYFHEAKEAREKDKALAEASPESILKADKNNYAIPYADVQKIEMKRARFHITTTKEKHKWYLSPKEMGWTKSSIHEDIKNLENILRPIFGDKLSVKK